MHRPRAAVHRVTGLGGSRWTGGASQVGRASASLRPHPRPVQVAPFRASATVLSPPRFSAGTAAWLADTSQRRESQRVHMQDPPLGRACRQTTTPPVRAGGHEGTAIAPWSPNVDPVLQRLGRTVTAVIHSGRPRGGLIATTLHQPGTTIAGGQPPLTVPPGFTTAGMQPPGVTCGPLTSWTVPGATAP